MIKISILVFMVSILHTIFSSHYYNVINIVEQIIQNQFTKIFGKQTIQTSIQFVVPPHIEGPEQEWMNETIGNPITFVCDATGIPPPKLAWFKNGKPLGNIPSCSFLLFFPPLEYCCAICSLFFCYCCCCSSVSR